MVRHQDTPSRLTLSAQHVYGASKGDLQAIREFVAGRIRVDESLLSKAHERARRSFPLPGQSEQAVSRLWQHFHNKLAASLEEKHPDWTDQQVFVSARRRVISVWQRVVLEEYLPLWGIRQDPLSGHDPTLSFAPSDITHSMLKAIILPRLAHAAAVSDCKVLPKLPIGIESVSSFVLGTFDTPEHANIINTLKQPDHSCTVSILQHEAQQEQGPFVSIQQQLQLPQWTNWSDVEKHVGMLGTKQLRGDYTNVGQIPAFLGFWVESVSARAGQEGLAFQTLLKQTIDNVRRTDECWYEWQNPSCFTSEEHGWVMNMTMSKLLKLVANLDAPLSPFILSQANIESASNQTRPLCQRNNHQEEAYCLNTYVFRSSCTSSLPLQLAGAQHGWWITVAGFVVFCLFIGACSLFAKSRNTIRDSLRLCSRRRSVKASNSSLARKLAWSKSRAVPKAVIPIIIANADLILSCQQGFGGDVEVQAAARLKLRCGHQGVVFFADVLTLVTQSSILCIDRELAKVSLLLPLPDVHSVYLLQAAGVGAVLHMRCGQMIMLDGPVKELFGYATAGAQALATSNVHIEFSPLTTTGSLLQQAIELPLVVDDLNEALVRVLNEQKISQVLNMSSTQVQRCISAYKAAIFATRSVGLTAAAFAHLTGTRLSAPLLSMIWKQHGINAAKTRLDAEGNSEHRALDFLEVCGGDMPRPGDQVVFDTSLLGTQFTQCISNLGPLAFIALVSILTGCAPREVQMLWLFSVLDLDHDGTISFEEVRFMLQAAVGELNIFVRDDDMSNTVNLLIAKYNVFSVGSPADQAATPPIKKAVSAPIVMAQGGLSLQPGLPTPPPVPSIAKITQATSESLDPDEFRLFVYSILSKDLSGGKLLQGQIQLNLPLDENPLHMIADLNTIVTDVTCGAMVQSRIRRCQAKLAGALAALWNARVLWLWATAVVACCAFIVMSTGASKLDEQYYRLRAQLGISYIAARSSGEVLAYLYGGLLLTRVGFVWTFVQGSAAKKLFPFGHMRYLHGLVGGLFGLAMLVHAGAHLNNFTLAQAFPPELVEQLLGSPGLNESNLSFWSLLLATRAGATGALLLFMAGILFIFSRPDMQRSNYAAFSTAHKLYILIILVTILHGSQAKRPIFWAYVLGPACLLCFDKLLNAKEAKRARSVLSASCVDASAIHLEVSRSKLFDFKAGAFVQLQLPDTGSLAWHPFTIMSAPHEDSLLFVVKRAGLWTQRLFDLIAAKEAAFLPGSDAFPRGVHIRGPYSSQGAVWSQAQHVVLIGDGIGITQMLAIVRDYTLRLQAAARGQQYRRFETLHMHLCWLAKNDSELRWLQTQLPDTHGMEGKLSIDVCFSSMGGTAAIPLKEWLAPLLGLDPAVATVHFERPGMQRMLEDTLHEGFLGEASCAVFACGPSSTTAEVTSAVRELQRKRGVKQLRLFCDTVES